MSYVLYAVAVSLASSSYACLTQYRCTENFFGDSEDKELLQRARSEDGDNLSSPPSFPPVSRPDTRGVPREDTDGPESQGHLDATVIRSMTRRRAGSFFLPPRLRGGLGGSRDT